MFHILIISKNSKYIRQTWGNHTLLVLWTRTVQMKNSHVKHEIYSYHSSQPRCCMCSRAVVSCNDHTLTAAKTKTSPNRPCDWLTVWIHRPEKREVDRKRALASHTFTKKKKKNGITENRWRHRVIKYALKQYHYKNAMHLVQCCRSMARTFSSIEQTADLLQATGCEKWAKQKYHEIEWAPSESPDSLNAFALRSLNRMHKNAIKWMQRNRIR